MEKTIYLPEKDSYLLQKVLKEKLLSILEINPSLSFLEIGIGSGIQLTTAKELGIQNIFGVDVNVDAINHCKQLGFNCVNSNLFENIQNKFDVIVFNPPYLPEDEDEPDLSRIITTGGKEGSETINDFLKSAKNHLNENGKIFLLISSLTKNINWNNFNKKLVAQEKIFFEELFVYELIL